MGKQRRLLVLTTLLLATLVMALGACSWRWPWQAAPTATPVPQAATAVPPTDTAEPEPEPAGPEPSATPIVLSPPARVLLQRALETLAELDSWHVEVDIPLIAKFRGLSIEMPLLYSGDFEAPNRWEGELSLQLLELEVQREVIFETQTMMVSPGEGNARRVSQRPASILYMMGVVGFHPGEMQDVEVLGTETLDGVEVYHLMGSVPVEEMPLAQMGIEVVLEGDLQFDLWIGVDDGLPHQGLLGGELAMTGDVEATLQVAGLVTLSEFGSPAVAAEAESALVEADGIRCGEADEFVEYADEERGIRFCYPETSVVNPLVETCSVYAVSPEGVALGNDVPGNMVLIYPDEMVETFGESASGALEVTSRTAMCTMRFLVSALIGDGRSVVEMYQATATPTPEPAPGEEREPVLIRYTGIQRGDTHAVSISYVLDEEEYGALMEAVTESIVLEEEKGQ